MRTKESLKVEIRTLTTEYARLGGILRMEINAGRKGRLEELLHARHEILLSISHRQGLLVQVLEVEIEYKEAS